MIDLYLRHTKRHTATPYIGMYVDKEGKRLAVTLLCVLQWNRKESAGSLPLLTSMSVSLANMFLAPTHKHNSQLLFIQTECTNGPLSVFLPFLSHYISFLPFTNGGDQTFLMLNLHNGQR